MNAKRLTTRLCLRAARGVWTKVDSYVEDLLVKPDSVLLETQATSSAAGLPAISVSPAQGKLLFLIARAMGARRILEIGTLGGYSTIWLARAVPPGGRVITLELNPKHAEVARANFARAGLIDSIELKLAPALDTLAQLSRSGEGPFDLVFLDADKINYPAYLDWALKLTRPGSLIIADNIVNDGEIAGAHSRDPAVQAKRRFNDMIATDARLTATIVQTVGLKGYDGFAVVLVT
jgi:predicted O-methyltransferase YrrM